MDKTGIILALVLLLAAPVCAYDISPNLSADAQTVAFVRTDDLGASPVIVVSPVSVSECRVLGQGRRPEFSGDGSKLLYLVPSPDKTAPACWSKFGLGEAYTDVWVCNVDGSEAKQLTTQGGTCSIWAESGEEIVYLNSSGVLCSLPSSGGSPKRITSNIPCMKCLTWLSDLRSFVATKEDKGKLARYAFTPPSVTPVRISPQIPLPSGALACYLTETGDKVLYIARKSTEGVGVELWTASTSGKRKVADIPLDAPLGPNDIRWLSVTASVDGRFAAAAVAGKIWTVELASGGATCVSGPAAQQTAAAQNIQPVANNQSAVASQQ